MVTIKGQFSYVLLSVASTSGTQETNKILAKKKYQSLSFIHHDYFHIILLIETSGSFL